LKVNRQRPLRAGHRHVRLQQHPAGLPETKPHGFSRALALPPATGDFKKRSYSKKTVGSIFWLFRFDPFPALKIFPEPTRSPGVFTKGYYFFMRKAERFFQ
jgi:hypothetical protein